MGQRSTRVFLSGVVGVIARGALVAGTLCSRLIRGRVSSTHAAVHHDHQIRRLGHDPDPILYAVTAHAHLVAGPSITDALRDCLGRM